MQNKKLELPTPPQYYEDTRFTGGLDTLFDTGSWLRGLDFGTHPLSETIDLSPDISKMALERVSQQMQPYIRDQQRAIINQLAANNQLESSVLPDTLSRMYSDVNSQMQAYAAEAAMRDINRALQNRIGLFGAGLDVTGQATGMAQENQNLRNQFNLKNYENQVASVIANQKKSGGLFGGLTGALGGGLGGFAIGGPIGGILGSIGGGLSGAFGSSGLGGQLLSSGAGLFAMKDPWGSMFTSAAPGSTRGIGRTFKDNIDLDLMNVLDKRNPLGLLSWAR